MIRMVSTKYFCGRCKQQFGTITSLYSDKDEKGEKTLNCPIHGFQQYCNCSPSDFKLVVIPDDQVD